MLGRSVANGTVFRRAIEEGLLDPRRLSVPETSSERGLAQFVPWIEPVSLLFIPSGL
jgi:hypothetical protein